MNLPRPSSDTPLPQDMRDQAGLRPAEMSARPGDADEEAGTRRALLRPLAAGLLVTAVFVVAAAIWASFARIDSAVE